VNWSALERGIKWVVYFQYDEGEKVVELDDEDEEFFFNFVLDVFTFLT